MKKFLMSFGSLLASLALFIGVASVNSPSVMFYHQPEVPESMKQFKK